MRVCIIGAGAAGLAAARQATAPKYGHKCVIFEQTGEIGGTWVYTEDTGLDEFGVPIHTSMYKNLRTNLPKEVMGFPDFKISECSESYVTQEQILTFLNDYADHFKLRDSIKFYNRVKHIVPEGNKWQVTVTDLKNKVDKIWEFDAIMICNGHYHTPSLPEIPGRDIYTRKQIHSHDFRDVNRFSGQKVLVIGAGPSGMDIALQISKTAAQVFLSHHCTAEIKTKFPKNLKQKPDVDFMTEKDIIFKDKTQEVVDVVLYCTGYLYSFPFLDSNCGVTVANNHVQPLFKHLININNTTMCFIGLPFYVCAFSMFDLQARFFLEHLKGDYTLPTKADMLRDLKAEIGQLLAEGFSPKHAHMMGTKQEKYYECLASLANITPLPPVMAKLHNESSQRFTDDLLNFREEVFRIVDENNFVKIK